MKMLRYVRRTVVRETDLDGNPVEREVLTKMAVPATDAGRALAEKEAYGEIVAYDDGQPETAADPTIEARVTTLEESSAEMTEALDMILKGATSDE